MYGNVDIVFEGIVNVVVVLCDILGDVGVDIWGEEEVVKVVDIGIWCCN